MSVVLRLAFWELGTLRYINALSDREKQYPNARNERRSKNRKEMHERVDLRKVE